MTAPARKATVSPLFNDSFAAAVVRAEALVAVFMPKNPHKPERRPATATPPTVQKACRPPAAINAKRTRRATNTPVTIRFCRPRYAPAPSRTALAILIISGSPSGWLITER